MYVGPIPDGAWVLHKCDNPPCVNPKHLFVGDVRDNVADAVAKGRNVVPDGPKGEAHHSAKLTEAEVDTIKGSNEGATTLARQYNVSRQMIWRIRKGKAWKQ